MTPIKKDDGFWHVDIRPFGRDGQRFRKKFKTRTDAASYIQECLKNREKAAAAKNDNSQRLSDLVAPWLKFHGNNLKGPEKLKGRLLFLANDMGNPLTKNFDANMFLEYRNRRLNEGATKNTVNHHLTYLNSMFNVLIEHGEWQHENPLLKVKKLKFDQQELTYLSTHEIKMLLLASKQSSKATMQFVIRVCLATGARWSEAEQLKAEQIKNGLITYTKTKNGLPRSVPVTEDLIKAINPTGKMRGRLFEDCYEQFKAVLSKSGIVLPKGQRTHVLRHSFASHYMINGGDILKLNKALGHKTLQQTMTYAHLAPDHLGRQHLRRYLFLGV